jgi:hypothetical protein
MVSPPPQDIASSIIAARRDADLAVPCSRSSGGGKGMPRVTRLYAEVLPNSQYERPNDFPENGSLFRRLGNPQSLMYPTPAIIGLLSVWGGASGTCVVISRDCCLALSIHGQSTRP